MAHRNTTVYYILFALDFLQMFEIAKNTTVDWNYFALENILEKGRKLWGENFCDQNFLRKFITTITTIKPLKFFCDHIFAILTIRKIIAKIFLRI